MAAADSLGIDFGTTNTVVALAAAEGPARLVRFAAPEGELFAFRSALAFQAPADRPGERLVAAGPWAIEAYAEAPADTRFLQSFKTFAAQSASPRPRSWGGASGSRTCSPPSCSSCGSTRTNRWWICRGG